MWDQHRNVRDVFQFLPVTGRPVLVLYKFRSCLGIKRHASNNVHIVCGPTHCGLESNRWTYQRNLHYSGLASLNLQTIKSTPNQPLWSENGDICWVRFVQLPRIPIFGAFCATLIHSESSPLKPAEF